MVTEAALLEAIFAAPERDEPRLVYADWLVERQDPRGELIHLQVAQARTIPRSPAFLRLQRRIDSLWGSHWAAWTPRLTDADPAHFCEWGFSRGFASSVHTVPAALVHTLPLFFAAAPLLDDVQLDCGRLGPLELTAVPWLEQLFAAPSCSKVKTLRLQSLNDAAAVVLCGLAGVAALEGLELARTNLGIATYELLGDERSSLHGLRRLELMMANARAAAIENLLEHPWPRLEALAITNEAVGERGMRAICEGGQLPQLRRLDLSWSKLGGPRSIEALAGSSSLPALEQLDLSHCEVTDAMCEGLAGAGGFRLRVLRLAHSAIGPAGLAALLDAPGGEHLQLLDLSGTRLPEATQLGLVERLGDRVLL